TCRPASGCLSSPHENRALPSLNLIGQSRLAGLFTGGLYALLGLGLSLTWGLLRGINLANFALAFLGAYLTYQLATAFRLDPILTLVVIVPGFFVVGIGLELGFLRFKINELTLLLAGLSAAYAAVAGLFIALNHTLAPSQIYSWIGVVFAAVIIGRLGNALGLLAASVFIAASEALTMAVTAPGWAPLVSFTLLIVILLLRPEL